MSSHEDFVHVYLLPLGPIIQQSEKELYVSHIPSEEKARIAKYQHWQDQQRALLGRALLQWLLKKYVTVEKVDIVRTETGRPYVARTDISWQGDFNLSHSGEWIVAAITNAGRVGADVEKIGKLNEDILPYVLSEKELISIKQLSDVERTKRFYELWTMKESIYKTGIFQDLTLDSIDTVVFKKKNIETATFYVDEHHPVSVSWNGASTTMIQKIELTREKLKS